MNNKRRSPLQKGLGCIGPHPTPLAGSFICIKIKPLLLQQRLERKYSQTLMPIHPINPIVMSNSVRVKEAVLVNPSEPTPNHVLHLSSLDSQLFLRFTVEYLLVYEPHVGLDKAATVARVKAALARVLVPYYPLAGRVRARADGSGLEVVCRAQGAALIEAASESCAVSEFERAPKYGTQWRKFLSLHVDDVLKGVPPLVVQLTWLADGGATLGVGLSHCLCDGIGGGEFLNSFAELASGRRGVLDGLKPAPVWSRHLMDPIPHSVPCLSNHPEFKKVPDTCGFVNRFCEERLVPTSVTFDKKCLNELKKIVMGEGAGGLKKKTIRKKKKKEKLEGERG